MEPLFDRVAIVGVGLIGGSVGLAVRGRELARRVVGIGHAQASLDRALARGAIDRSTLEIAEGVRKADLIVVATPVERIVPLARAATGSLQPGATVIDVGSTKARIVAALEPIIEEAGAHFVGCHPLAGSEKRSIDAARGDLFEGTVAILTATERTDARALSRVERLWQAVGSRVIRVSPAEHDALVAYSSHLPHLTAAALVLALASASGGAHLADLAAGGFRDTTRVASGDPRLWRDILLDNRACVVTAIDALGGRLAALREALVQGDSDLLAALLAQAKETRDGLAQPDLARG